MNSYTLVFVNFLLINNQLIQRERDLAQRHLVCSFILIEIPSHYYLDRYCIHLPTESIIIFLSKGGRSSVRHLSVKLLHERFAHVSLNDNREEK